MVACLPKGCGVPLLADVADGPCRLCVRSQSQAAVLVFKPGMVQIMLSQRRHAIGKVGGGLRHVATIA